MRNPEQAARLGVDSAQFRVGDLIASGLPAGTADAVLCTDSIQFPDEPVQAYAEIRRILKPGGRVVLTGWEPTGRDDERLSDRMRRADLAAGLQNAGFTWTCSAAPAPAGSSCGAPSGSAPLHDTPTIAADGGSAHAGRTSKMCAAR